MPLDIPRDDNYDDSWPDIPGYQVLNVANEADDEDAADDDSDFDFTSDEEDGRGVATTVNATDTPPDRYAQYTLISQGLENGDVHQVPEDEGDANQADGRFFQHNFVVQWIETNEPLFDRAQFEARQARENATTTATTVPGETSSQTVEHEQVAPITTPREESQTEEGSSGQNQHQQSTSTTPKEDVKMDKEQIDIIKGLMSNFKLPEDSVPGWAKEIPEEQWKSYLSKRFDDKAS